MWSREDSGRRQSSSAKVSDQEVPPLMWIQRIEQVYWCLVMNVPVLSGKITWWWSQRDCCKGLAERKQGNNYTGELHRLQTSECLNNQLFLLRRSFSQYVCVYLGWTGWWLAGSPALFCPSACPSSCLQVQSKLCRGEKEKICRRKLEFKTEARKVEQRRE